LARRCETCRFCIGRRDIPDETNPSDGVARIGYCYGAPPTATSPFSSQVPMVLRRAGWCGLYKFSLRFWWKKVRGHAYPA
jgi:hypothetical protein